MNAIHQGFLRVRLTRPETGFFHQVLDFYYGESFDSWLPRSESLDGLRAQAQVHALRKEEMKFNIWQSGAHALLKLFEKEPVLVDVEAGKTLVADLSKKIERDIEKLTTCTNI